ncbi:unnamed protein product, partial [Ascophyllum nodosum]
MKRVQRLGCCCILLSLHVLGRAQAMFSRSVVTKKRLAYGCIRRPWQQHQKNANTATEAAASHATHEETTRPAAVRDADTRRAWQQQQENADTAAQAAASQATHEETTRPAAVRDADTRRAWQQQQENADTAAQ